MIVKIYALIWGLGILAAVALYPTGNLGPIMTVVFGFLTFGAIFMGMIGCFPKRKFVVRRPNTEPGKFQMNFEKL